MTLHRFFTCCPTAASLVFRVALCPSMAFLRFGRSFSTAFKITEEASIRMSKPTSAALCPSMALPKFARSFSSGAALRHSMALPKLARSFSKFEITEEMLNTMPIQMWWDLDNYVPDSKRVSSLIVDLIDYCRWWGLNGPVSMVAYGDTHSLPAETRSAIAAAMTLNHVPPGTVIDVMSGDMIKWGEENPPPACFYLVSGNRQFLHTLNKFNPQGYTTLAALPHDE